VDANVSTQFFRHNHPTAKHRCRKKHNDRKNSLAITYAA
jgi:hypothetical protein